MAQMPDERVDYDEIALVYDERYQENRLEGIAAALTTLAGEIGARRALEAGCGTGRWLGDLQAAGLETCGLDISFGMLEKAHSRDAHIPLVCGSAGRLPFHDASFDLVCCVNALHHFDDRRGFIFEARRLLRPGGALAIIGMDPHAEGQRELWYLYDCFPGTYELDLRRFPRQETVIAWMNEAGFARTERGIAEHIVDEKAGRDVLENTFIQKHATSQLALLSDEAYEAGLRRIEAAIARADAAGETIVFRADIPLVMVTGRL
jgi:SAM-dependent methyltransferase